MSTGLAFYGLENARAEDAFRASLLLLKLMGYPVTGAGYYERVIIDGSDDIEIVEVSAEELLLEIKNSNISDFRVYSNVDSNSAWAASVGFSSNNFGDFFCMDFQCVESFLNCQKKIKDAVKNIQKILDFSYAIIYELDSNYDAMWYARGDNYISLYENEAPGIFSKIALKKIDSSDFYGFKKLRMVYPMNFLNGSHILIDVEGVPLLDWIREKSERGRIAEFGRLWCWEVELENIKDVNDALGQAAILLAWQLPRKKYKPKLP